MRIAPILAAAAAAAVLTAASRAQQKTAHWAFEPVRARGVPHVTDTDWPLTPVDRFVLAKLEAEGLHPRPPADSRTLIRRATFDLIGLPPTAPEVDAFVSDDSPDAFTRVIDRLLASPHYGERQARHWLDVARYADTKGYVFQEERRFPFAYTYRDWVIAAFNTDLPYDEFVIRQIAADRLDLGDDRSALAAMGFLTVGRRFLNNAHDIIDDRIDVVSRGTMALTVSCARCHDHKFDPIPTADYYSLYGVFASSREPVDLPAIGTCPDAEAAAAYSAELATRDAAVASYLAEQRQRLAKESGEPVAPGQVEGRLNVEQRNKLTALRKQVVELKATHPGAPPHAMVLVDAPEPADAVVFLRGDPHSHGPRVPRRFLSAVAGEGRAPFRSGSGRLELARAIASPDNPLTARVLVNRVWMHLFGRGLVTTPSDFGTRGDPPSHPELLDWLALRFVRDGWSVKELHRLIVSSRVYQQSSAYDEHCATADPDNRLLWRSPRRRLDFEQMRDAMLAVSGGLDPTMGGRAVPLFENRHDTSRQVAETIELGTGDPSWNVYTNRRSVYLFIDRQNLPGTFRAFDFANPDAHCPRRHETTVPQRALFLLNSPFVAEQARRLVELPEVAREDNPALRVRALCRRVLGRPATAAEVDAGVRFVAAEARATDTMAAPAPVWRYGVARFCQDSHLVLGFSDLPHFTGSAWQGGEALPDPQLGWVTLNADGGHPGSVGRDAVRRWTAPQGGVVAVDGVVEHPAAQGDGVIARVVSSRHGLLATVAVHRGRAALRVAAIEVRRGDTLDFVIACGADEGWDSFSWAPVVRSGAAAWRASADFAGPPGPARRPLSPWAKYAQVLLMTNEFAFVD